MSCVYIGSWLTFLSGATWLFVVKADNNPLVTCNPTEKMVSKKEKNIVAFPSTPKEVRPSSR